MTRGQFFPFHLTVLSIFCPLLVIHFVQVFGGSSPSSVPTVAVWSNSNPLEMS